MSEKKPKIQGYKVRDIKTGLYVKSFGSHCVFWSKKGKMWSGKGYITASIRQSIYDIKRHKTKDFITDEIGNWEIIEFSETNSYPLAFLIDKITE